MSNAELCFTIWVSLIVLNTILGVCLSLTQTVLHNRPFSFFSIVLAFFTSLIPLFDIIITVCLVITLSEDIIKKVEIGRAHV
jgi:uncharacterized membrane protein